MRKLFNYALLAAALLVGVNVNAETIQVSAIGGLEKALFDAQDGDVVQLSMTGNVVTMTEAVHFYAPVGTAVTLDLNGKKLQSSTLKFLFHIYRGQLTIKNGEIESTADPEGIIQAYGASSPQESTYTKLILDKSLTLTATGKNAIVLNDILDAYKYASPYGTKETFGPYANWACNLEVEISCTIGYAKKYGVKLNGQVREPGSKNSKGEYWPFFGGLDPSKAEDVQKYMDALPYIHVTKDANITAASDKAEACGIYCSGYGHYLIEGTVTGATGVYIKGGQVTIDGADISSNSTTYYPAEYKDGSSTSGKAAQGSAIIIEGSAGSVYAGGSVTITGDAKITSGAGYAIEGLNLNPGAGESKIDAITVVSGTINGTSGEGTINFSADVKTEVTQKGSITGGTYSDDKINDVINQVNGVVTPVDDGQGGTTYIVTPVSGGKTAAEARVLSDTTQATTDIMLKESLNLTTDAQCKNLVVEEGATLTINKKLTVAGTLTILGNVIVKKNATLIVKGNGVSCFDPSKFVIELENGQMGQFILSPNVTGNKHPQATAKLTTKAYNQQYWERFGSPIYEGLGVTKIQKNCTMYLYEWNYNTDAWSLIQSGSYVMKPFLGYTFTTNASQAGTIIGFPGQLVGVQDVELDFYPGWNTFSNSFVANVDLQSFLESVVNDTRVSGSYWIYNTESVETAWTAISLEDIQDPTEQATGVLAPMQAFLLENIAEGNVHVNETIDYTNSVWSLTQPTTPGAPRVMNNNTNKVVINISANGMTDKITLRENDQYDAEFNNGADVQKYMNSGFNIYAPTQIGNLCQVATNDIEGQTITIATTEATSFTMSFSNLRGEKMALRDNLTGDVIEMAEGVEYNFMANANEVSERFTVVSAAKAPTAIENAAAKAKAAKFINKGQVVLQNNGRTFNVLGVEL